MKIATCNMTWKSSFADLEADAEEKLIHPCGSRVKLVNGE